MIKTTNNQKQYRIAVCVDIKKETFPQFCQKMDFKLSHKKQENIRLIDVSEPPCAFVNEYARDRKIDCETIGYTINDFQDFIDGHFNNLFVFTDSKQENKLLKMMKQNADTLRNASEAAQENE